MKIQMPLYHKIWWEGEMTATGGRVRLIGFNGKENIVLEERNVSSDEYERLKWGKEEGIELERILNMHKGN